jgi:hypothetical protein
MWFGFFQTTFKNILLIDKMIIKCEFCKHKFTTKSILKTHQKNSKYCLDIQGKNQSNKFECKCCHKLYTQKIDLQRHQLICSGLKIHYIVVEKDNKINQLEHKIQEQKDQIQGLQDKLHEALLKSISSDYNEPIIEIEEDDSDSDPDNKEDETYHLTPLDLGKNYNIKHRDEDGFINVTDLCNAGGKQFNDWKRLQKTTAFLKVLSKQTGNPVGTLINTEQTSNTNKTTWVHPQVSINIAQWISPKFDVMVSAWVYEVMMSGKVDISNTKTYRQLQSENKNKSIKIQYLTKKYVKSQPRVQYKEHNVIYILTTKNLKKERRYILGKAVNLTNRLSTYNKSDEHEVVFYQECPDEDKMGLVENMVFSKLQEYREQANRERFILPEGGDIEMFSGAIKKCVEFVK